MFWVWLSVTETKCKQFLYNGVGAASEVQVSCSLKKLWMLMKELQWRMKSELILLCSDFLLQSVVSSFLEEMVDIAQMPVGWLQGGFKSSLKYDHLICSLCPRLIRKPSFSSREKEWTATCLVFVVNSMFNTYLVASVAQSGLHCYHQWEGPHPGSPHFVCHVFTQLVHVTSPGFCLLLGLIMFLTYLQ